MAQKAAGTKIQAKGTYEIVGWDEKTWEGKNWNEQGAPKLTHAKITQHYHGDIEGEAAVQFLMAYPNDSFASIVGLQHVTGRIGGRAGSFMIQSVGTFENGAAKSNWSVVPGSGTGDLKGLRGEGSLQAEHDGTQTYTFEYSFE